MSPADVPWRVAVSDHQIGDAVHQLRTEIELDPPLIHVPAKIVTNGRITGREAELFQKVVDRDLYLVPQPLIQCVLNPAEGFII